jgi:hypothetical protein
MKAREIAALIFATYPAECKAKLERSAVLHSDADLLQQLVAEIGANRPQITKTYPKIKTTEGRPRQYYWSNDTEEQEVATVEGVKADPAPPTDSLKEPLDPVTTLAEADLYPKLGEFLRVDSGLYVQRIDERRSSNRRGPQGNRWLFPDIVALEDLTSEWTREVRECVAEAGARKTRLWSFEVKLLLNRSNVRECYFQAVSNSSWANFAYLVASEIEGSETLKELRMLAALHGVGLIRLDPTNPTDSEVMIPARERPEIDWANCDRLAAENSDFSAVIRRLWEFHRTGAAKRAEWAV